MEEKKGLEQVEPKPKDPAENVVRKRLKLEWIDSEWFQVWLKLARREAQQPE
jgi:hypothetical protein